MTQVISIEISSIIKETIKEVLHSLQQPPELIKLLIKYYENIANENASDDDLEEIIRKITIYIENDS